MIGRLWLIASLLLIPCVRVSASEDPSGFNHGLARSDFEWGVFALREGDTEAAIEHFRDAIRNDPDFSEAYVRLGYTYGLRRDFASAMEVYDLLAGVDKARAAELWGILRDLGTIFRYRIPSRPTRLTLDEWREE